MSHLIGVSDAGTDAVFIDPVSVEAWDAWFRWRDAAGLHDLTVEDTWQRVAEAVAIAEPREPGRWRQRFATSMGALRLLPDERILADAGHAPPSPAALYAAVNLAAFVRSPFSMTAEFDAAGCMASAALAVRLLEDAADLAEAGPATRLRVGFVGLADAIAMLCREFGGSAGQDSAAAMLAALHAGCTGATARLQTERGRCRRFQLVVEPHPRLCVLANNVADGVDPLTGGEHVLELAFPEALALRRSSGFALTRRRYVPAHACAEPGSVFDSPTAGSQLALRAALLPWLESPPATPLRLRRPPAPAEAGTLAAQAQAAGLPEPAWRVASA